MHVRCNNAFLWQKVCSTWNAFKDPGSLFLVHIHKILAIPPELSNIFQFPLGYQSFSGILL